MVNENESSKNKSKCFILDSGSSQNLCSDIDLFNELNLDDDKISIKIADGKQVISEGIGNIKFRVKLPDGSLSNILLEKVLYMPDLDCNLISISNVIKHGHTVEFKNGGCSITNKQNKLCAYANESEGLFKLDIFSMNDKSYITKLETCNNKNCILKWHARLAHRNFNDIKRIEKENLANGILLNNCKHNNDCENCILSKLTKKPFSKKSSYRSTEPLNLIFVDLCGPLPNSLGGKRYFMILVDDFSRYTYVYFLSSKDEAYGKIKQYVASVTNKFGRNIKGIRSDNGREFKNNLVEDFLNEKGIKHEFTVPYTPQQNTAERYNRIFVEMAKTMLNKSKLPKSFWAEAISTAVYIHNRLPSKSVNKTPYELFNGYKPNISHFKIFGCKAFAYVDKHNRKKLDNRAQIGTFIGYDYKSKGYRIYTGGRNIIISRTVRFIEDECVNHNELEPNDGNIQLIEFDSLNETKNEIQIQDPIIDSDDDESVIHSDNESNDQNVNVVPETVRRSNRLNKGVPPERFSYKSSESNKIQKILEPENFKAILSMSETDKSDWLNAMQDEINSLKANNTFELVNLPANKKALKSKWIYKIKYDEKGRKIKNKARLVAAGYLQKFKVDYDQTFSPVVKHSTIRSFIANAAIKKLRIYQLDIKTAFLYGNLNEEIYLYQPEGFEDTKNKDKVWKLNKSLYGLKQAAKCWNDEIENTLIKLGFKQSKADLCLYFKNEGRKRINLIVYVDDLLITCEDENEIKSTIDNLKKCYELTDLGEISYFLGMEVIRNSDGSFKLSQNNKIKELVKRYNLEESAPTNTPMETNFFNSPNNGELLPSNDMYQEAIGSLLYISSVSRPDITAATHILSRKCNNPTTRDWNAVKRIIRYLNTTKDTYLTISSNNSSELSVYSDADWAQDTEDRKSTSGNLIFIGNSLVSWSSKKQSTVSLSSAEAEYIALSQATQELLWFLKLCEDLELNQQLPVTVFEDNQSAIKLAESEKYRSRTKHIDTKYHHIRDLCSKNIIKVKYLPTKEMTADIMTKPLPKPQFFMCKQQMNLSVSAGKRG